jgi:hypothetical protein
MQLVGSIFMVQVQEMQGNRYLLYVVSEVLGILHGCVCLFSFICF